MDQEDGDSLGIVGFQEDELGVQGARMDQAAEGDGDLIDVIGLLDDGSGVVGGERILGLAKFHTGDVGRIVAGDGCLAAAAF